MAACAPVRHGRARIETHSLFSREISIKCAPVRHGRARIETYKRFQAVNIGFVRPSAMDGRGLKRSQFHSAQIQQGVRPSAMDGRGLKLEYIQ